MNLADLKRLMAPLGRKVFLLLGRAILNAVNNSENTQKIQITALDGETISDMERFQEYGFETYPVSNSEVFAVFLNGNRDHGVALCVHDRRYRPKDLSEGDVALYTYRDKTVAHRIHLKSDGEIEIFGTDLNVTLTGDANITADGVVNLNGGSGNLTGVVCGRSICHFTGTIHGDVSQDVNASKV